MFVSLHISFIDCNIDRKMEAFFSAFRKCKVLMGGDRGVCR